MVLTHNSRRLKVWEQAAIPPATQSTSFSQEVTTQSEKPVLLLLIQISATDTESY